MIRAIKYMHATTTTSTTTTFSGDGDVATKHSTNFY